MNDTRKGWAGLAARLALALVLIAAGAAKRAVPSEEFAVVIEAYGLVSVDAAQSVAGLLPWAELLLGFALLLGFMTPGASAAAGGMFGAFLFALMSTKARGIELPNCGCFGSRFTMSPAATMLLDVLMIACAFAAFRWGAKKLSLDNWSSRGYTGRA